jgi:hypothetical protein
LVANRIFPLIVAPVRFDEVPVKLNATSQIADISLPEQKAEGFERLVIGPKRAGLDLGNFEWPQDGDPNRPIYPNCNRTMSGTPPFGRATARYSLQDRLRLPLSEYEQRAIAIRATSNCRAI